ncbi:hypothetical protein PPHE_b0168 [Pseudoalteromonas phenolica O-BC30]|nr:hypothetical protein [Pseudoalteromonas phenolica O-BC30]
MFIEFKQFEVVCDSRFEFFTLLRFVMFNFPESANDLVNPK